MGEPVEEKEDVFRHTSPNVSSVKENEAVETVVCDLVERASFWSEPSTLEKKFYTLDYRKAPSLGSASSVDGSEFGDLSDCELSLLESDEDSDKEFERLQRYTCEVRLKKFKQEHPDGVPDRKKSKTEVVIDASDIQNEYDALPPLEKLSLHCDESIPLEIVGHVTSIVGCLVVIQSEGGVALDFDSVLFDKDRNSIGVVFDLFGPVRSPLYSVRFNTKEEAAKLQVGMKVYYAPKAVQYTRTVIETQVAGSTEVDDCSSEDEALFSDDEKEREYRARKSAKARSTQGAAPAGVNDKRAQKRRVQFSETTSNRGGRGRGGQQRGGRGRGGSWNWHSERGGYPGRGHHKKRMDSDFSASQGGPPEAANMNNPYAEYGCHSGTSFTDSRQL